jgi:large repetitive protein
MKSFRTFLLAFVFGIVPASVALAQTITTSSMPDGTVGVFYSQALTCTNCGGAAVWGISAGALPPALAINSSTGVIAGPPNAAGLYNFTVSVQNPGGPVVTKALSITIFNPPNNLTTAFPNGTVNVAYPNHKLAVNGGKPPYTWSIFSGSLPPGLAISGALVSGTPTAAGTYPFTLRVTDSLANTSDANFSITIYPPLTVLNTSFPNGTVNAAYPTQNLQASGGQAPYSWSISASPGPLPPGLGIVGSTIAGTPTTAGSYPFSLIVTDNLGNTAGAGATYTIVINAALTNLTSSFPTGAVGAVYPTHTLSASGGTPPYKWTISSGSLPPGLGISGSTIAGTPTTAGTYPFTLLVTDSQNVTAPASFSITINAALTNLTSSFPNGTVGVVYPTHTLSAGGGSPPYTWSISSGTLPPGLGISGSTIVGTPTTAGTYPFTLLVTDSLNATAPAGFSIVINASLTNLTSSFPNGTLGVVYPTHTLSASGGSPPYAWSISSGSLPPGLGISGSTIGGTPTASGTYAFTLLVTDSLDAAAPAGFSITISTPAAITTSSLPNGNQNVQYSAQLACTTCNSYAWSIPSGLPPGLSVNAVSGLISGIPTAAGTYPFTVFLRAQANNPPPPSTANLSITIIGPALTLNAPSLPGGSVNSNYTSSALSASGGVGPPYNWSISSGSLPPGLGLTTNAGTTFISGVPTSAGTYNFTLTVADSASNLASLAESITVFSGAAITTAALPNGIVNQSYSAQLTCVSCTGYVWSLSSGALPPVLSIGSTGLISGNPTTVGTYNFVVSLASSNPSSRVTTLTAPFFITINPTLAITAITLPVGTVNMSYSAALAGSGGAPPYTWSFSSGNNDGLTINASTGVISGTPTAGGQFALGAMIADSGGATATRLFTLFVTNTLSIATTSLPNGKVGTVYPQQALSENGGQSPFRWSISVGTLPPGLTLNPSFGTISGTPTTAGTYPFTLGITDALNNNATVSLSITVAAASNVTITITTPTTLPGGAVGTAYSQTLTAAGGAAPYTWTPFPTPGGVLPAGLTLNAATGVISGTPTTAGTATFGVTATDKNGVVGQATLSITITATTTPLSITTTTLAGGTVGKAYSQTIAATGGATPYAWSVPPNTLPAGLTLNTTTGVIGGTPTSAATSSFTVTVTDASKNTASQALSIAVIAPLTVTAAALPNATVGVAYTQTPLTVTGGVPPYKFSAGALPSGFSLSASTGAISGTPPSAESGSFTVTVTDSAGATATAQLTLTTVAPPPPTVTLTGLASGFLQQPTLTPTISSTYTSDITGTITLTFTPSVTPSTGVDDLMIQFSNGSRTINFTIPAGSTTAPGVTVLTGTTAGTITLTTTLSANGATLGAPATQTIVNNAGVPFISKVTLAQVPGGLTVTVTGFSSTRDMSNGQYAFVPAANDSFASNDVSVALNGAFATWYGNTAQSNQYGTQFTLTVPFTLTTASGSAVSSVVAVSVTVTLSNSKGASNPVTLSQ